MTNNQEILHPTDEKKKILVVEDEAINREILKAILENNYDVLLAEDGAEALKIIEEKKNNISLVILDLIMPNIPGREVLRQIKSNEEYQNIPVIVASGDQTQEIECLSEGASDFIQKPYPEPGVILARVRRTIELFENRHIIQSTERDPLTGLYNREFFYIYAEQYELHHPEAEMDAILIDINHFSTINERYGRAYGDEVLRRVGQKAREMVHDDGGIVCRREGDIFQVYCPHRSDYKAILDNASLGLTEGRDSNNRVRLRMGVYSNVDKSLDIERRFDRAKMAADTVRGSYTRSIGIYDDTIHKSELYHMRLIEDFPAAIEEKQLKVYFQPKYDIRHDTPVLYGAEALIRWQHPELGMIMPGIFIPLFEGNGLIQSLDHYAWREVARQIREWKDKHGFSVPVSVNVSRVDISDSNIVNVLSDILEENDLTPQELHLEITESAYAEDSEQIIEIVSQLRSLGFPIEMDDFGTGYSSLNMLSTLPIDILKLDMKFIQSASTDKKNIKMIGIIMDIARHIATPVIAEGVETKEQLDNLKELNCDIIQGNYFSAPVPADEFETFLLDKREWEPIVEEEEKDDTDTEFTDNFAFLKKWSDKINISMRKASLTVMIIAIISAISLFIVNSMIAKDYLRIEEINKRYVAAQKAADDMEISSDYLTDCVRCFVITGEYGYLENYFKEAYDTNKALNDLQALLNEQGSVALGHLNGSLEYSDKLKNKEYIAMQLTLSLGDYEGKNIPQELDRFALTPNQKALSPEEKRAKATELVFDETYGEYKAKIKQYTVICTEDLIKTADEEYNRALQSVKILTVLQAILTATLLIAALFIVTFINVWIRRPIRYMLDKMKKKESVDYGGAEELRLLTETYNTIFEENRRTHEYLTYGNMHDALTGLYNRSAYNYMKKDLDMSRNALLLVDVDKFKLVNDTYGHDVGDLVLKRVAEVLQDSFRATDLVFRLGGDEFVVIMMNANSSMRELVRTKIEQANVMLQKPSDDLPPTSLSVGIAFADRENPEGDIFKDADTALYRVKEAGRCGCYIY